MMSVVFLAAAVFVAEPGAWPDMKYSPRPEQKVVFDDRGMLLPPSGGAYFKDLALPMPESGKGKLRVSVTIDEVPMTRGDFSITLGPRNAIHEVGGVGGAQWGYWFQTGVSAGFRIGERNLDLSFSSSGGVGGGGQYYLSHIPKSSLPVTVSFEFDRGHYQFLHDKPYAPHRYGYASGTWNLVSETFNDDMTLGFYILNRNADGAGIRVSKVRIEELPPDAPVKVVPMRPAAKSAATPEITAVIRPDVLRSIGGYETVQPIFSGTFNGNGGTNSIALVRALNLNGARSYFWNTGTPEQPVRNPPKANRSEAEYQDLFAAWTKQDFARTVDERVRLAKERRHAGQIGQLFYYEREGITNDVVFHTQMQPDMLAHKPDLERYFDAYVGSIRRHAPWMGKIYVQFQNEPELHMWPLGCSVLKADLVQKWIETYDWLSEFFVRRFDRNTQLIGPCLETGTMHQWDGWERWSVPVLTGVKRPLEYFNYHCYDVGAFAELGWMSMVQALCEKNGRPRPRAIVTETNAALYTPDMGGARCDWLAQQLFMQLDNPDKFSSFCLFLVHNGRFSHEDIVSIDTKHGNRPVYNAIAYVYLVLSELRGKTVDVEASGEIPLFAAMPDDRTVVFAAMNDKSAPRTVRLSMPTAPAGEALVKTLKRRPGNAEVDYAEKSVPAAELKALSLGPGEIASVRFRLAASVGKRMRRETREYLGDAAGAFVSAPLETRVKVPRLPKKGDGATLRFAVASDDWFAAREVRYVLNGVARTAFTDDGKREFQNPSQNVFFLEIPLEPDEVKGENVLTFLPSGFNYRLMFVSVRVVEEGVGRACAAAKGPDPELHAGIHSNGLGGRWSRGVRAGKVGRVAVCLENRGAEPKNYRLTFSPNKVFEPVDGKASVERTLLPHSKGVIVKDFRAWDRNEPASDVLSATLESDGVTKGFEFPCAVRPRVTAVATDRGWAKAQGVTVKAPNGRTVTLKLMYERGKDRLLWQIASPGLKTAKVRVSVRCDGKATGMKSPGVKDVTYDCKVATTDRGDESSSGEDGLSLDDDETPKKKSVKSDSPAVDIVDGVVQGRIAQSRQDPKGSPTVAGICVTVVSPELGKEPLSLCGVLPEDVEHPSNWAVLEYLP